MHVVLMTLGNIRKSVRRKIKKNAYILLAEIPSPKFERTHFSTSTEEHDMPGILRRQLFHSCMSIVLEPLRRYGRAPLLYRATDPDGYMRKCAAILAGWIGDMEELWTILGVGHGTCPKCVTTHADLDSPCERDARTSQWILDTLSRIRRQVTDAGDTWQFVTSAKKYGLFGIEKLCWEGVDTDICRVVCFDILHTLHKGFYDHLFDWVKKTVGEGNLDMGLIAQPHLIGRRNFGRGISHLSQLSGREHRDLQRHVLPAILGNPGTVPQVQTAVRAFLDFSYKVQFPAHSDVSLELLEKDLATFYRNYQIFISNGSRDPPHMKIPKLHYLRHAVSDIKYLGALDGLSTETMETLHRLVKTAYPLTNRRQFTPQIIRLLQRVESVQLFAQYIQYTIPPDSNGNGDGDGDGDGDGIGDGDGDGDGEHNGDSGGNGNDNNDSDSDGNEDNDSTRHRHRNVGDVDDDDDDTNANSRNNTITTNSLGVIYRYSARFLTHLHSIDEIVHLMPKVDVISPFVWFFIHGKDGTSHRTQRQVHQRHEVPEHLVQFYTWVSLKLESPAPNKHYQREMRTLRCNPGFKGKPIVFDSVVVETEPQQSGLKRAYFNCLC
jgi:Plavaka transposase